jgi:hypothetical protein
MATADKTPTNIYTDGQFFQNSALYRGGNDLVVLLSQLVGRSLENQPELLSSVNGSLLTAKGLLPERGEYFIYYVRGTDTNDTSRFVSGSQGKAKKIVTFPMNTTETTIIRVNTFFYQNPVYPTKVTQISDYEEPASWYMQAGVLLYDVNSATQNNIQPN